jgi:hypothetical protein
MRALLNRGPVFLAAVLLQDLILVLAMRDALVTI